MALAATPVTPRRIGLALALALPGAVMAQSSTCEDDFKGAHTWPDNSKRAGRNNDLGLGMYTDSGYQMMPIGDNAIGVIPAPRQVGANAEVQAQGMVMANDGSGAAGVVCRMQDNRNFYAVMATANGQWIAMRAKNRELTALGRGALPQQLFPDTFKGRIGARCEGGTITVLVDGKVVGRTQDSPFPTGKTGIMIMGKQGGGTYVIFERYAAQGR